MPTPRGADVTHSDLAATIADAARKWEDAEFDARAHAVLATLDLDNTFTVEALDFAIDQLMHELTAERLQAWIRDRRAPGRETVAVLSAGNLPCAEFQDWLAVTLTGHRYVGVLSSRSNALLPAFVDSCGLAETTSFDDFESAIGTADRLIATGSDDTVESVQNRAADAGIPRERLLLRGASIGVAVLTGSESATELIDLAEDCLLHEGRGCRNVAIVWAPAGTEPDRFLEAAATFRSVFPAPESTSALLRMPKAMLEALQTPCAYADDLSFLVSSGGPEVMEPCHIRWTEYADVQQPVRWLSDYPGRVQVLATNSEAVGAIVDMLVPVTRLGTTQRPPISWNPDGVDTVEWLATV